MTHLQLINRLFDPFIDQSIGWEVFNDPIRSSHPRTTINETESDVHVYLDVPGFQKEQLNIEYKSNTITIKGLIQKDADNRFGLKEFQKTIQLSETLDTDKLSAQLNHGVLEIKIPYLEKIKQVKQIPIT